MGLFTRLLVRKAQYATVLIQKPEKRKGLVGDICRSEVRDADYAIIQQRIYGGQNNEKK